MPDFSIGGLTPGFNSKEIIEKIITAEKRQIAPVIQRQEEKAVELETWGQVKALLQSIRDLTGGLTKRATWESKLVSSTRPDIVSPTANSAAKPGKYTMIVDKLALNHQIASQKFAAKDAAVGRGSIGIRVGDGEDVEETLIQIDETKETLQGVKDAINGAKIGVSATIIKTGNDEKPFQLVVTSKKTGLDGAIRINLENLQGGDTLTFESSYTDPAKWKGIPSTRAAGDVLDSGASTAIPEFVGTYTGEDDVELKFTVINSGRVGESENLQVRWEDGTGEFGVLDVGSFNYSPGEPLDVVDGIQLILSDGDLVVNDSFTVRAKAEESSLFWWTDPEDRAARIDAPSAWKNKSTVGGPKVTGDFTGEEEDEYTLVVKGSGEVGASEDLRIEYFSEEGVKGSLFVGRGYQPGTKLSLGDGLELSLEKGILNDGDTSTFEAIPGDESQKFWWLKSRSDPQPAKIEGLTAWIPSGKEPEKVVKAVSAGRKSTASRKITGVYDGFTSKTYTFTVEGTGTVGTTKDLKLNWKDNEGNSGMLDIGSGYTPDSPLPFDSGLSVHLGAGKAFDTDSFQFRTATSVIQPPQDAEVRFGATASGGGLRVTSSTNTIENLIDGVKLELLSTDEKPVTIEVKADTEKAVESILGFVEEYNNLLKFIREVTKYVKDSQLAGPLQGDRNLPRIQQQVNYLLINPVSGLPTERNTLFSIGIKLNSEGSIDVDQEKLRKAVSEDFEGVSNLFRSIGKTENSGIVYLSSTPNTKASGAEGYDIDIEQAPTKGFYLSKPFTRPLKVDAKNDKLIVDLNGRQSDTIELEHGTYTAEQMAQAIRKKIQEDRSIKRVKFNISVEDNRIKLRSHNFGARSTVNISAPIGRNVDANPVFGGQSETGLDAQGTIDGEPMTGTGPILAGPEGTKYDGLKIFANLTQAQLGEGPEGNIVFTKGVATQVEEYIAGIMRTNKGDLSIYTKNVEQQFKGYRDQIRKFEGRIQEKRERLKQRFARVESNLAEMRSQQNYLNGQLAKL